MLSKIINELKKSDGPVMLDEIARRIGTERSALDGMIGLLVQMGRIRIAGDCNVDMCAHCGSRHGCSSAGKAIHGLAYELVPEAGDSTAGSRVRDKTPKSM